MIEKFYRVCAVVVLAFGLVAIGSVIGYMRHKPTETRQESHVASVVQSDGSIILERSPSESTVAPMKIPKGAKMERIVKVSIKPKPSTKASDSDCTPVTLDLALVRKQDNTRRVIASSPDGVIIGGVDIPVSDPYEEKARNAAGIEWIAGTKQVRPWIERDYGNSRIGTSIWEESGKPAASIRVGFQF